ncbi:CHAP domain-containing protein [Treponema putidum]|uniref:CHAP domain-containing protein n=1 Tax=Treponema putidum TaxID=221027 RepID=UPI003D8FEA16
MTLDGFVKKYNGKKVDFDGRFGCQCVDLFRQYCEDVLNIPHTGGVIGAAELYTKYEAIPLERKYFEKIEFKETPPIAGDVVIFKPTKKNGFGHVAIVLAADNLSMTVFEQDGFAQTGAYITERKYYNALGFLRKRSGK